MNIKGKKLLVLGGGAATLDIVKCAREMGVYTVVTDYLETGAAKKIADETAMVSTTDFEGLKKLIEEKNIDGVFCGPSEFNIRNLLALCEYADMPCYTTTKIWDHCANKDVFKSYCREYGVDCTPEFDVDEFSSDEEYAKLPFPVIVKPVDGNSSHGISTCADASTLREACRFARSESVSGKIIVEKYIENNGELFSVRYLLKNGEAYPYFMMDTYIVDPEKRVLISHLTSAPSKHSEYYMKNMDASVRKMLKGMGLTNGTAFIQSLPCDGKIYFHEMGYRLSGGMLYKLTKPLVNVHDMKMMIALALGEEYYTEEEMKSVDLGYSGRGVQLTVPLRPGKIEKIEGLDELIQDSRTGDFIQYYYEGDTVKPEAMGTLSQHFGRFTFVCGSDEEMRSIIDMIQTKLKVTGDDGEKMNVFSFDLSRLD